MPWPLHTTRITAEVRLDGVAVITLRKPLSGAVSVPVAVDPNPPLESGPGTLTCCGFSRPAGLGSGRSVPLRSRVPIRHRG
jgi:hypothetical protein